jgi:rubrerythrin
MEDVASILQTALDIERQARRLYLEAAEKIEDPVVKSVLVALADDEESHENHINSYYHAMQKHKGWPPMKQPSKPLASLKRIEGIIKQSGGRAIPDNTFIGVYEAGRDLELWATEFYQSQAEAATDRNAVEFFRFLASLENAHLEALQMMLDASVKKTDVEI